MDVFGECIASVEKCAVLFGHVNGDVGAEAEDLVDGQQEGGVRVGRVRQFVAEANEHAGAPKEALGLMLVSIKQPSGHGYGPTQAPVAGHARPPSIGQTPSASARRISTAASESISTRAANSDSPSRR